MQENKTDSLLGSAASGNAKGSAPIAASGNSWGCDNFTAGVSHGPCGICRGCMRRNGTFVVKPYAPYGLLVCAVRYALGRRSYVVSEVCGYVRGAIPSLKPGEREVIARDIRTAGDLGDDCDKTEWLSLLDALERDVATSPTVSKG